jgi:hypothetical protein
MKMITAYCRDKNSINYRDWRLVHDDLDLEKGVEFALSRVGGEKFPEKEIEINAQGNRYKTKVKFISKDELIEILSQEGACVL